MRHRTRLTLLAAVALALAAAPAAFACSCVEGITPTEMEEMVDAVFLGRVVSFEDVELDTRDGRRIERRAVFEVRAVWKGLEGVDEDAGDETEVYTGRGGGDCGYRFTVGELYLVYADDVDDRLRTTICARTNPFALAGRDLDELGPPRGLEDLGEL